MVAAFLNKPYPHFKNSENNLLSYALIGAFVGLFLSTFQPFGISEWVTPGKTLKLFGFGLVSFIVPTLLYFLLPRVVPYKAMQEQWTVGKEILLLLLVLLCIAAGNLFYGRLLGIMPLGASAYLMAFAFTVAVGIFPISIHVVLKHNQLLRHNLRQTAELNQQLKQHGPAGTAIKDAAPALPVSLHFIAENGRDVFDLAADRLLYIASADNYSNIVFMEGGKIKKHLFRSSLKRIEGQLPVEQIIRCHRAYIINLNAIKNIEGNAAGYKVFFNDCEDAAYVSRNYIDLFNQRLKALK